MGSKYNNFIVFDFETGGLDARKEAAVEIACVCLDGNTLQTLDTYESIIKPFTKELAYSPGAYKTHGISEDKMIKEGKNIQEVVQELEDYFVKCTPIKGPKNKPIIVGQNVQFDIPFLFQIFLFCKKDLSKYIQCSKDIYGTHYPNYIDVLNDSRRIFNCHPEDVSLSLGSVCNLLGIELNDAHRAMNDTIATAEVFKLYTQRLRSIGGSSAIDSNVSRFRNKFQLKFPEDSN